MGKFLGWWEFSEAFFVWVVCRERFFLIIAWRWRNSHVLQE